MSKSEVALSRLRQILLELHADAGWLPGDSLHRVPLSAGQDILLRGSVRTLLHRGPGRLQAADQRRWGAAMLLLGARALGREAEGPFTYARMGELLGIDDLDTQLDSKAYEAMDQGARLWNLKIPRVHGRRQFMRTMLRHSGGGWPIVEALLQQVVRRWSFASLAGADIEAVAGWIEDQMKRESLGKKMSAVLRDSDTRYAIAEKLLDVAAAWAAAQEALDESPVASAEDAVDRLRAVGVSELLDAPDHAAEQRTLETLLPATKQATTSRVRWRWSVDASGDEALTLEVPHHLRLAGLPRGADRVRVRVVDGEHGQRCIYSVHDGELRYLTGTRLLTPPPGGERITVVAEYRHGDEVGEMELAALKLPGSPVALFIADTGKAARTAPPGTSIALVPRFGCSITGLDGFRSAGREPWRGWVGTMPTQPMTCTLRDREGERAWQLVPANPGLDVTVANAVPGLRLDGVSVVCGEPSLRMDLIHGKVAYALHGSGDQVVERGQARVRARSLHLPVQDWTPGRYRIDLDRDGATQSLDMRVLPESVEVSVHSDAAGTHLAIRGCERAQLRVRGTDITRDARLLLGREVRGSQVADVTMQVTDTSVPIGGTWRFRASPMVVDVVAARGGQPVAERDIAILRGGGGLRIQGKPRTPVRIRVGEQRWGLLLSAQGERFVPFTWIPSQLLRDLQDRRLNVEIRWSTGPPVSLSFVDSSAQPLPHHNMEPAVAGGASRRFLHWEHPFAGDVHVDAVAAWRPWEPAIQLSATPGQRGGQRGYIVTLDIPHGPYQMALMDGERRMSGMGLVWSNPTEGLSQPSRDLDPLERELWLPRPDRGRLARFLAQRLTDDTDDAILAGLLRTFSRYGTRWFRIAEVLISFLGAWRLRALVDEAWPMLDLVESYYSDIGMPWLLVSRDDMATVGDWLAHQEPGTANALLLAVSDLRAGLLVGAVGAWQQFLHIDAEQVNKLAPLQDAYSRYQRTPEPVSHEALERVRLPGASLDTLDDVAAEIPSYSQRVLGLLELRGNEEELWTHRAIRQILDQHWPAPDQFEPRWFIHLPERLERLERTVALMAWHLHQWRRGHIRFDHSMHRISVFQRYARYSFDYWLNTWDAIDRTPAPPRDGATE